MSRTSARTNIRYAVAAVLVAMVPTGCGADGGEAGRPIGTGMQELHLERGGEQHRYLLYVPPGYDRKVPVPLVLVLHGRPGIPYQVAGQSGMNDVADGAGFSAGGSLSWRLAAGAGDQVAAIASVGGPYGPSELRPDAPVSALAVVGLADRAWLDRIERGLAEWRDRRGCAAADPVWVDDLQRTSRTVATCDDGSELVEYRVEGLVHEWPESVVPEQTTGQTIWEFFAAHARRAPA